MARLGDSLDDNINIGNSANTIDEFEKVRFQIISDVLSASSVDHYIYIAPQACVITGVSEIHITAGSSGTLMLEKCGSTGAIGSTGNTDLLTSALDLAAAAETVQAATLSTASGALTLAADDRIAIDFVSTGYASLVGSIVTINLYQNA